MGLSPMEHGIYRLLMDTYYMTEQPLELDLEELMRSHSVRTADEQNAFKYILKKYFKKTPDGYRNSRCVDYPAFDIFKSHGLAPQSRSKSKTSDSSSSILS